MAIKALIFLKYDVAQHSFCDVPSGPCRAYLDTGLDELMRYPSFAPLNTKNILILYIT